MKQLFLYISLLPAVAAAQGQWSMDECMDYAASHGAAVEQARWDLAAANADLTEAIGDFFPSVQAQVGAQFNWGRNIDPETNTYNNVTTFNNGYGIYASMMLFDGGQTFNRYRRARVDRQRSRNAVDLKRDDLAISAMMAYVDAVYYLNSMKIADDRLAASRDMLLLTERQEELGMKGRPDVAQARATVADDEYNRVRQENLYTQAMLTLRTSMNLPADMPLEVDSVAPSVTPEPVMDDAEAVYSLAAATNPRALDADMAVRSSRYALRTAKGLYSPTISLSAGISTSYFKTITDGYTAPSFGDQFRNNRGEYVSATITIPLFSGMSRVASVRRASASLHKAESARDEQLRRLHDDIASAVADRRGYAMEILALEAKTDADLEAYTLNRRKFEEGLLSMIDLQISANTYYASRVSLLQKQMLYILKTKLVDYYKGEPLWMSR